MIETVYRAGVMRVAKEFPRAERMLPPEHRIAAIKDLPDICAEDWLIEGPSMPAVAASEVPGPVEVVTTLRNGREGQVGVFANWRHAETWRWTIGVWPSFQAFKRDFCDRCEECEE
jgi:hypothetical protein